MPKGKAVPGYSAISHRGHGTTAGGNGAVMFQEQVRGALLLAHALETTGPDDAVTQLKACDAAFGKDFVMVISGHIGFLTGHSHDSSTVDNGKAVKDLWLYRAKGYNEAKDPISRCPSRLTRLSLFTYIIIFFIGWLLLNLFLLNTAWFSFFITVLTGIPLFMIP